MLWEHEPHEDVSTAFSSSHTLSRDFLEFEQKASEIFLQLYKYLT